MSCDQTKRIQSLLVNFLNELIYLFALITEEKLHITLVQLEWKNGKKIVCGGVGCVGGVEGEEEEVGVR